jgi:dienelactone hydrolase
MRLIEIMILLVLFINLINILFIVRAGTLPALLIWLGPLLVLLHGFIEGTRWQMYPAYLLTAVAVILYFTSVRNATRSGKVLQVRWQGALFFSALLFLSISLPALLPVPRLQEPGGSYTVGTMTMHLTDPERRDPYAPDPSSRRELMVQVWYPATPDSTAAEAPWMDSAEIVAPKISAWLGLPGFFLNHLRLAESGALLDPKPFYQDAPYPVLLFSHGYGGFRAQNTNQALELASHGFVVVAVEHTYAAVVTVFPDGRVAAHNPDTLPDDLPDQESIRAARDLGRQWARDLEFVLDRLLDNVNQTGGGLFNTIIDANRVGAFGHSTGGGAVIEYCTNDPRCDAILTMDPYLEPVSSYTLEKGLPKPALHMFSERWSDDDNTALFNDLFNASSGPKTSLSIAGTAHYDFSDLPLLTPLAHLIGLKGPLNGERVTEIVNSVSVSFFEHTLLDDGEGIYSPPLNRFPELRRFP